MKVKFESERNYRDLTSGKVYTVIGRSASGNPIIYSDTGERRTIMNPSVKMNCAHLSSESHWVEVKEPIKPWDPAVVAPDGVTPTTQHYESLSVVNKFIRTMIAQ